MPDPFTSGVNSAILELDSEELWQGEWEVNSLEHVGINCLSDQDGTLTLEFSIDGQSSSFSTDIPVYADVGRFRTFIKLPGRYCRASFTNGSSAASVQIITSYGNNLFPAAASPDGELLTTVTERERNVGVAYAAQDISTTTWVGLIDKSDNVNWPHDELGRLDISVVRLGYAKDSSAQGAIRLGVVVAINGTQADVEFFQGINFDKSSISADIRDFNYAPSQIKLSASGGQLTRFMGSLREDVTAVNTATPLAAPRGRTFTPAVGDVVAEFEYSGTGAYDASILIMYHSEVSD